ncbi:MAG: Spx/MgsR family RNA polymerase-binding regulatory protein [Chitinophagaceae bacterium]|nr:Spx/MgsR family RNA polymerase-binding regulatory protein [Chitinophagaceae bacterium]
MILYGIPTCDATKKAMAWLKKKEIGFQFHDYRVSGIEDDKLNEWIKREGLEKILNKKSTTWRNLSNTEQARANSQSGAVKLMKEHTTLIKRPIVEKGKTLIVGQDDKRYEAELL